MSGTTSAPDTMEAVPVPRVSSTSTTPAPHEDPAVLNKKYEMLVDYVRERYKLDAEQKDKFKAFFDAMRKAHHGRFFLPENFYEVYPGNRYSAADLLYNQYLNLPVLESTDAGSAFKSKNGTIALDNNGARFIADPMGMVPGVGPDGKPTMVPSKDKKAMEMADAYNIVLISIRNHSPGLLNIKLDGPVWDRLLMEKAVEQINLTRGENEKIIIDKPLNKAEVAMAQFHFIVKGYPADWNLTFAQHMQAVETRMERPEIDMDAFRARHTPPPPAPEPAPAAEPEDIVYPDIDVEAARRSFEELMRDDEPTAPSPSPEHRALRDILSRPSLLDGDAEHPYAFRSIPKGLIEAIKESLVPEGGPLRTALTERDIHDFWYRLDAGAKKTYLEKLPPDSLDRIYAELDGVRYSSFTIKPKVNDTHLGALFYLAVKGIQADPHFSTRLKAEIDPRDLTPKAVDEWNVFADRNNFPRFTP